jgi:anti-sigma regulatory factor (Ser/Thr protein kinase)
MPHTMTLELPREADAPSRARQALAGFDHDLPPERDEAAQLLVSELVTNAVKYGGSGPVQVEVTADPRRFRTEVIDRGSGFHAPARDTEDLQTPGGWGLHLVEMLSDRWGAHEGSTHVWFELKK